MKEIYAMHSKLVLFIVTLLIAGSYPLFSIAKSDSNLLNINCRVISKPINFVSVINLFMSTKANSYLSKISEQMKLSQASLNTKSWSIGPKNWSISADDQYLGIGGYTSPDLIDEDNNPTMLFNPKSLANSQGHKIITHEFVHLIHNMHRPNEDWWIKEGVAMLGQKLLSCEDHPSKSLSQTEPIISLTELPRLFTAKAISNSYNQIILYFEFLYENCGGEKLFLELLKSGSSKKGTAFIDQLLTSKTNRQCQNFKNSFTEFQIHRYSSSNKERPKDIRVYNRPQQLLPESASVYKYQNGFCETDDLTLVNQLCLQVNFSADANQ